jgi:hypothetical protein
MLLNQLITWMRAQAGTTSLRALVYMDEVFGFFPPVANPPSKKPMLTLMKQARAFGIGMVLTTQNPADLDYKGLTNAGTWFIGRLQAERDKMRLLEGLESASAQAGNVLDRGTLDKIISSLGKRVFMLHNVHESQPVIFNTRWAMSYLRGPLTRMQIRDLMNEVGYPESVQTVEAPSYSASPAAPSLSPSKEPLPQPKPVEVQESPYAISPPVLPARIQQIYLPLSVPASKAEMETERKAGGSITVNSRRILYIPAILGMGDVHFVKNTKSVQVSEEAAFTLLAQPPRSIGTVRWEQAENLDLQTRDLLDRPEQEAYFDDMPDTINESKDLTAIRNELEDYLYRSQNLTLRYNPATELYSNPGEDERAFSLRVSQAARELRDDDVDDLEERYERKIKTLEDRLRSARVALEKQEANARLRKQDALLSAGETVFSLFSGRRRSISAAARKVSQISTSKASIDAAEEKVEVIESDIEALKQDLKAETDQIVQRWEEALEKYDDLVIKPRRTDVEVTLFALTWVPHWYIEYQTGNINQTSIIPAYKQG